MAGDKRSDAPELYDAYWTKDQEHSHLTDIYSIGVTILDAYGFNWAAQRQALTKAKQELKVQAKSTPWEMMKPCMEAARSSVTVPAGAAHVLWTPSDVGVSAGAGFELRSGVLPKFESPGL